jgi:hypothetical protein
MKLASREFAGQRQVALAAVMLVAGVFSARAETSRGEARARAIVQAFSNGDATAFERAAQENYSAAALARRTAEQRAQALSRIFDQMGGLEIVETRTEGSTLVATTRGAKGGTAVFTFVLGASPELRIESVSIQTQAAAGQAHAPDPYAPYVFLIGEWESSGGIRQSLRWGPEKSYIWYGVYTRAEGAGKEELHQEGLMTFNGRDKDLDFLFVHDPGSFNQEQGTVHVEADGVVVRETTAISGDGTVNHFRQTWRQTGPSTAVTSVMRQNPDGSWTPTFPGSDKLEMTRRPG